MKNRALITFKDNDIENPEYSKDIVVILEKLCDFLNIKPNNLLKNQFRFESKVNIVDESTSYLLSTDLGKIKNRA